MRELTKSEKKALKGHLADAQMDSLYKFTRMIIGNKFESDVKILLNSYGFSIIEPGNLSIKDGKKYDINNRIQDVMLPSVSVTLFISCLQEIKFGGNVWIIKRADFTWFPDNETQEDFINNLTQFLNENNNSQNDYC